jgi:hypothetical protein
MLAHQLEMRLRCPLEKLLPEPHPPLQPEASYSMRCREMSRRAIAIAIGAGYAGRSRALCLRPAFMLFHAPSVSPAFSSSPAAPALTSRLLPMSSRQVINPNRTLPRMSAQH